MCKDIANAIYSVSTSYSQESRITHACMYTCDGVHTEWQTDDGTMEQH